jgi:hypothetical protein
MRPLYPLQVWSASAVSLETGRSRQVFRRIWCKLPLRNFDDGGLGLVSRAIAEQTSVLSQLLEKYQSFCAPNS